MIKKLISIFLLHMVLLAYSQFAIVEDKDGFVNVREGATVNSGIINQLNNGHLIFCFEKYDNWMMIDFDFNNEYKNGFIYKNRFKLISDYPNLSQIHNTKSGVIVKNNSIEVQLSEKEFDQNEHNFGYDENEYKFIVSIDNKRIWGTDGEMPKMEYDKIVIRKDEKIIILPEEATQGLYQPSLNTTEVNYDEENDIIYIQTMNSDGAGGYLAIWKIQNNKYIERFIAYGF